MSLELLCAIGDGTELSAWPKPIDGALVGISVDEHRAVFLTEEQAIELVEYLESLITGDSHGN